MMQSRQGGISLTGLIFGLVLLIFVALFAMKVIPAYIEYNTAKTAIDGIVRDGQANTPTEVRRAFNNRSAIDDITAVKPEDLEIEKEGNELVIGFAYRKEVPLFANVGLYIDFAADTRGQ